MSVTTLTTDEALAVWDDCNGMEFITLTLIKRRFALSAYVHTYANGKVRYLVHFSTFSMEAEGYQEAADWECVADCCSSIESYELNSKEEMLDFIHEKSKELTLTSDVQKLLTNAEKEEIFARTPPQGV